jgi:hypothetical protein
MTAAIVTVWREGRTIRVKCRLKADVAQVEKKKTICRRIYCIMCNTTFKHDKP